MDDFKVLTSEELKPVLDVLTDLEWPIPFTEVPQIVSRLGWCLETKGTGKTTLPVSFNAFMITELRSEISDILFWVTDALREVKSLEVVYLILRGLWVRTAVR